MYVMPLGMSCNRGTAPSRPPARFSPCRRRGRGWAWDGDRRGSARRRQQAVELGQAERLEHRFPAPQAGVLGLDLGGDRLALGVRRACPRPGEAGPRGRRRRPPRRGGGLGLGLGAAAGVGAFGASCRLDARRRHGSLAVVAGGDVVVADRGDEVAGRVLGDPLVLVLHEPVEDLQLGPDPPRRVAGDQLGGGLRGDAAVGQRLDQRGGLGGRLGGGQVVAAPRAAEEQDPPLALALERVPLVGRQRLQEAASPPARRGPA